MKEPFPRVQSRIISDCDHPSSISSNRTFVPIQQRNPEGVNTPNGPETLAVILLNGLGKLERQSFQRSLPLQSFSQPDGEILAEAAVIEKLRLDLTMLEHLGFDHGDHSRFYFHPIR